MEEKKNLEIISGDGSDLEISPVYDNINSTIPKDTSNKPKNIVVPKTSKEKDKDKNNTKKDNQNK